MSKTIIFGVGTLVFIAVATATFIWGYLQFDALRLSDDGETQPIDTQRLQQGPDFEGDESVA